MAPADFAPGPHARHAEPPCMSFLGEISLAIIISLLIIRKLSGALAAMPALPIKREFAFTIMDVARMLRTYADQRARQFGISRAQWVVLIRIDRTQGLKQSELAEILDLQPISLTRLLDRLAESGLIERRADPNDRRANRLVLTPAAKPMLDRLAALGADMMETVLDGLDVKSIERTLKELGSVKENLRRAINRNPQKQAANG
ncbi:MAG TPA: MarR family transcriptional regulator [Pseudolabrys sp.]|nr:MarR family transcriptional regulator [Pseudolabrys sp.]